VRRFEGFHEESTLPVRRGDLITIKKGTTIHTTMPRIEDRTRIAGRTYKVRIDHILNGITITEFACSSGETPGHKRAPSVRWPGTGGYWFEADINDIPEAQKEP